MADTTKNYSDLDAFLGQLGTLNVQPKAKKTSKPKSNDYTIEDKGANAQLTQAYNAAEESAANFKSAIAKYQAGILTKDGLANIFKEYTDAQDNLYKMDAPGAAALQSQYFPNTKVGPTSQTTTNEGSIAPTLVFGADGKPEKNPDGSYKTQIVDQNGNVNGVAPTIVYDKNGQPVKNPDGSYKTAVGATMPDGTVSKSTQSNSTAGNNSTLNPLTVAKPDARGYVSQEPFGPVTTDQLNQSWADKYGGIGAMALTIPWMKNLLAQAATNGWSATKFSNAVKNYTDSTGQKPWDQINQAYRDSSLAYYDNKQMWGLQYNDKLDILQKSAIAQGEDPSVFGAKIDLTSSAAIDAAYKDQHNGVNSFFNVYYNNIPDQATIDKYVSNHTSLAKTDQNVYAGVIGQNAQALTDYAESMGISPMLLPSQQGSAGDYYANAAKAIQDGTTTIQEQQNYIKQQAIATYAPFANRIKEGMSVKSLASPYINAASNLLEISPDKISLGDTQGLGQSITTALQGDGTTPMALDKFMTQIKQRPEWLQTTNARNSLMDTATSLLRNFGMVAGG